MKRFLWIMCLLPLWMCGQNTDPRLQPLLDKLAKLHEEVAKVESEIEVVKLDALATELKAKGLPTLKPGEELIMHSAMALVYSEEHEQPKWVAHMILPDITTGKVSRTNDFREDPLVKTGTTVEADYFLKHEKPDGKIEYDGFGYDRGHLAPSADFRWSRKALSESYFYSNMSPQLGEFNREIWADLEGKVRGYIYENPGSKLFVVTGPLLEPGLPVIERSINKPSIPKAFFKVIVDMERARGIGFIIPHGRQDYGLETFAVSIDEVEKQTGLDFFASVDDALENKIESSYDIGKWLPEMAQGDVEPMYPPNLPPKHFNTVQAKLYMDQADKITICGTVVSTRISQKGNILMNLDKKFPNQIFTVFVRKQHIPNFSYNPEEEWMGKSIAVTGKLVNLGGVPAMFIENEKQIRGFEPGFKAPTR